MIRERWPIGKYTFSDIDAAYPKWLGLRVLEFQVSTFFQFCTCIICFCQIWFFMSNFNTCTCFYMQKYYRQLKRQSRSKAKTIIEDHIKVTIKRTMNELKRRVERKSKEQGVSKLSLKPDYWNIIFWKDLLNYWETNEGHLHRSEVGAANRQRVERLHSAGARSFNRVREVILKYAHSHTHKI